MGQLLESTVGFLKEYGYLPKSAKPKSLDDKSVVDAIALFQRTDANVAMLKEQTGTPLLPDGKIGPATSYAMALPRCACRDIEGEPALGSGGWANCHGMTDGHKAIVKVNRDGMPGFLKPHFEAVLRNVQKAYAEIGLLFVFVEQDGTDILTGGMESGRVNVDMIFTRGAGWIGLAIVGTGDNQRCSSKIWAKFHYGYQPANIVREWTTLIKHELGHNCGLRHTSGGVMNPSIVSGLPVSWKGDPSYGTLARWFGGDPIDVPGDKPDPPPDDGDDWPGIGEPVGDAFSLAEGVRVQLVRVFGG